MHDLLEFEAKEFGDEPFEFLVADLLEGFEDESPVFGEVEGGVFEFVEFGGGLLFVVEFAIVGGEEILSGVGDISDFDGLLINNSSIKAVGIDDIVVVFKFLNDDIITTITLSPNFFTSSTCPA